MAHGVSPGSYAVLIVGEQCIPRPPALTTHFHRVAGVEKRSKFSRCAQPCPPASQKVRRAYIQHRFRERRYGARSAHGRTRQIKLNAFMRPASIHTGAWRYPGAWPDMNFNFAHIKELHPEAGGREVRRLLHGRPHGRAEHADGCAQAEPHLDLVRAVHAAVGAVAGDLAHRPRRHRLDHLRRALSHRAALRLARPHQRRPRRLEHRHHVQSRMPR